jgi:DNA-binding NarL/FixJ family response regulator
MVKSQLSSSELLKDQIFESIKKNGNIQKVVTNNAEQYVVSSLQGEILKMIADGLSNAAIAKKRNITLRAAEASIQRTFAALDIKSDPDQNSRVIAVQLWQQGKVVVK